MAAFQSKLVDAAKQELATYGDCFENQSPLRERIKEYWTFLNHSDRDGASKYPWSAAFISFMVHQAGAGGAFRYSGQHSVYFHTAVVNKKSQKSGSFWAYKIGETDPVPGDILGMNRGDAPKLDYDTAVKGADFSAHADIVVEASEGRLTTIGGNVGHEPGQIANKTFNKTADGWVNAANAGQSPFLILRGGLG